MMKQTVCPPQAFLGIAVFGLLLVGCGEGKNPAALTASSTQTAQAATLALPQELPEEEAKYSGGLGLSHKAFELRHGKPLIYGNPGRYQALYLEGDQSISFYGKTNINSLRSSLKGLKTVDEVRRKVQPFLPNDAQLLETYSMSFDGDPKLDLNNLLDGVIDRYHSNWLAKRFTSKEWQEAGGNTPGAFYIKYGIASVEIGKAPPRSNELSKRLKNYSR